MCLAGRTVAVCGVHRRHQLARLTPGLTIPGVNAGVAVCRRRHNCRGPWRLAPASPNSVPTSSSSLTRTEQHSQQPRIETRTGDGRHVAPRPASQAPTSAVGSQRAGKTNGEKPWAMASEGGRIAGLSGSAMTHVRRSLRFPGSGVVPVALDSSRRIQPTNSSIFLIDYRHIISAQASKLHTVLVTRYYYTSSIRSTPAQFAPCLPDPDTTTCCVLKKVLHPAQF